MSALAETLGVLIYRAFVVAWVLAFALTLLCVLTGYWSTGET